MEAVYSNLILFLIFMRMRVVYHCLLASGLLKLVCTFSVPKKSRSEAHGLSEVLKGLFDFNALFLHQIILHVFEFH